MDSADKSIPAAILTAAYLDKSSANIDRFMSVYGDFLARLTHHDPSAQTKSDESGRRQPAGAYEYKRTA